MNRRASTTTQGVNVMAQAPAFSTIPPWLLSEVCLEIGRARVKYPEKDLDSRIDGFMQEAGEASQALVKFKYDIGNHEKREHARMELIQCMGQIIRLLTDAM